MRSKNNMKKLGTAAVILMILVCAAAVIVAVIGFLGDGEASIGDFLNGVTVEEDTAPELRWQTSETEGDITAVIETSFGKIVFKLDDSAAAARFISNAGAFGRASFSTIAKDMFIQAPALSSSETDYEENGLGCFYGAVGFAGEDGKIYDSLVIITAKELSGISKAYISGENFDQERAEFYEEFGGVPEYESKVQIFGQVVEGFDVLEKISAVETSGYTGGYSAAEPVEIISVSISYPKTEGQLE